MTGNRSYLTDYEEIDGGFVAFGGNSKGGKITGKGKIRTGKLDFEDVYFVKELKFNLFSVSQMCDKKNSVLFTDTECVVLSPDFKLTDESHVLLKVPRKDNMYSVDLKNVIPQGGLTCLFAKATPDESNLWHRRLGHVNFKTMNKLVRGNLVRGLPLKLFEINQTCVACQKGKQHRASCIENLIDLKVKVIRCDNGTEFKNRVMNQFCEMNGRKPTLSFMRPFRCPVTILNTIDHLGKFDGKADEGFFVGYSTNSKAFRVFNSRTRIVEENLHVQKHVIMQISLIAGFKPSREDEKKVTEEPGKKGCNSSNDQENDDNVNSTNNINNASNENSTNNVNIVNQSVNVASIEDNAVDENTVYGCADDPNIPNLEEISRFSNAKNDGAEADINNLDAFIPVSPVPTTRIHKDHPLQEVWTLVELPNGKRAIGTKWVFRNKKDERGIVIKNKERLVAQGYTQEEGIDYDEVFSPVSRIKAIRLFLAYALFKDIVVYQMDVKNAFLYGKIEEEVYVCQPSGFEDRDFPDRVYKVENALYGLHQAPRAWYETLSTYLLNNRFQRGKIDKTLFIRRDKGDILLVQVYVDDIIFGSTKKSLCTEFEKLMHKKFQMIYIDNESIICIVKNPVFHSKIKHIEIRHHFIIDSNEKKLIQMIKIHTDQNVADLLTKAFNVSRFQYLIASIEMLNL
ncbi:retrovirus-related pol polyprotein from transposon TNT 1-94 [Tanacetum coccineum]